MEGASGLIGKRALVTGGSSGIGRAIGTSLAAAGARVVLAAREPTKLNAIASRIGALTVTGELSTPASAVKLATQATELLGGLDILVLSSGGYISGSIADLPETTFADMMGPNVIGPAALARCLAPMLAAAGGHVLVVNSTVIKAQNIKGRVYFAASQHAMRAFTDGLRDELNDIGVRVTSLFPGTTATPRQERLHQENGVEYRPDRLLQPEDVAALALAALLMPPTAEITDVYIRSRYKT